METIYKLLKVLIAVLLAAVIALGIFRMMPDKAPAPEAPEPTPVPASTAAATGSGMQVPDFTVYDAEGSACKLSDFLGKPIILNFWASWCGPCKAEMPDIEESYKTYSEDIHFLIVNLTDGRTETVEVASAYIGDQGYTFPVYYDTAMEAAYAYSVSAIPATFFIDAAGNLVHQQVGMMSADTLQQAVDLLLS